VVQVSFAKKKEEFTRERAGLLVYYDADTEIPKLERAGYLLREGKRGERKKLHYRIG